MKPVLSLLLAFSLGPGALPAPAYEPRPLAPEVLQVGYIEHPPIRESSGIVASRRLPGVFWTHNDGGKRPTLYAIDRTGKLLGEYPVAGVKMQDWEDIALDEHGRIYLGDLGNNHLKRTLLTVSQVDEPAAARSPTPAVVQVRQSWNLRFPGEPFDCESLIVLRDVGYVISKVKGDRRAEIFSFPLSAAREAIVLRKVATLPVTSPVTGADLTHDGQKLGLVSKAGPFVFRIDGNVARAGRVTPVRIRFRGLQIEGCTFVPEGLLATAESREVLLFTSEPFRP